MTQPMTTLIKREWWEHKGGFGWGPLITLGVMVSIALIALAFSGHIVARITLEQQEERQEQIQSQQGQSLPSDVEESYRFTGEESISSTINNVLSDENMTQEKLQQAIGEFRNTIAGIFYLVLFIITFFVLLGALHDDRKDKTILFWKSIPVTDGQTVASKLVHAIWVAPLATIAAIIAAQLFFIGLLSILASDQPYSIWGNAGLLQGWIALPVGYLVQGLWSMPIWGYLLLVSAVVRKSPFVKAALIPLGVAISERVLFGSSVIVDWAGKHMGFAALPRSASIEEGTIDPAIELADIFGLLGTADMWLGVVIGAAFLAAAIYFRRRYNEL